MTYFVTLMSTGCKLAPVELHLKLTQELYRILTH